MADLALTSAEMVDRIEELAGWAPPTPTQSAQALRWLNDGLRRFLRGQWYDARRDAWQTHAWNFLRPLRTLAVWPTVTGTIATATHDEETTLTTLTIAEDSDCLFYGTMIGKSIFITDMGLLPIVSVLSSTQICVAGDQEAAAEQGWQIMADGRYGLLADFGGLVEPFVYLNDGSWRGPELRQIAPADMDRRHRNNPNPGEATAWCLEPRAAASNAAASQRWNLALHPIPQTFRLLSYRQRTLVEPLTDTATYPPGGADFADAILECGLARVEVELGRVNGPHEQTVMQVSLPAAVALDIELYGSTRIQHSLLDGDEEDEDEE